MRHNYRNQSFQFVCSCVLVKINLYQGPIISGNESSGHLELVSNQKSYFQLPIEGLISGLLESWKTTFDKYEFYFCLRVRKKAAPHPDFHETVAHRLAGEKQENQQPTWKQESPSPNTWHGFWIIHVIFSGFTPRSFSFVFFVKQENFEILNNSTGWFKPHDLIIEYSE